MTHKQKIQVGKLRDFVRLFVYSRLNNFSADQRLLDRQTEISWSKKSQR
jgi:hypothetical protein